MYQQNETEILLIGIKRHLLIAQDTSQKKDVRIQSLSNLGEAIEYVLLDLNTELALEERQLLKKFFSHLLIKIKKGLVSIHTTPCTFDEEIGFINVLLSIQINS